MRQALCIDSKHCHQLRGATCSSCRAATPADACDASESQEERWHAAACLLVSYRPLAQAGLKGGKAAIAALRVQRRRRNKK